MEPSAKEFVKRALEATGLSVDELAEKLDYKSLRRAMNGEIPLPDSKRKHIQDIVQLTQLLAAAQLHDLGHEPHGHQGSPREKLRAALAAKGLSIPQLAKLTKYKAGTLEGVIEGGGRISEDMARAIVRELPELTVDELLEGSETPRVMDATGLRGTAGATPTITLPGKNKTRYVPLIQWAAASSLAKNEMPQMPDDDYEHEGIVSNVPGRAFAVEVRGDSMAPKIEPGDYAIVRVDTEAREGEIVLVRTLDGDVLCKRYATRDGGRMVILSSINPSHAPREVSMENIAWIYPVKQLIRNNPSGL